MKARDHNQTKWLGYNAALTLLSPLWGPYVLKRLFQTTGTARRERMGRGTELPADPHRLWLHGASVGEMAAAKPILQIIHDKAPQAGVVISTITPTGRNAAEGSYPWAEDIRFFPLDVPSAVRRSLNAVKPALVAIIETELWPNFLYLASRRCPVVLINGRISDKTFRKAGSCKALYAWMFSHISVLGMQTQTDADRAVQLGAPSDRVSVLGISKFDEPVKTLTTDAIAGWRSALGVGDAPVIVAGSTFSGEDEAVCRAVAGARSVAKGLKAVIAPRHLERAPEVMQAIQGAGLRGCLRTDGPDPSADVIVLNTFGELAEVYGIADAAFIGKSLCSRGGQNLIQPMAHGVPVVYGPHMENFRDVAAMAEAEGAAIRVQNADELKVVISDILGDPQRRHSMGKTARALVERNRGASERYAELLLKHLYPKEEGIG